MNTAPRFLASAGVGLVLLFASACSSDAKTTASTSPTSTSAAPPPPTTSPASASTTADTAVDTTVDLPSVSSGSVPAAPSSAAHGTLTYDGQTYDFTNGRCSDGLDPNQFLFRDPPNPGIDATYFAITVTDVTGTSSTGGAHAGAVTFQQNGSFVVTVSDATVQIADDLSGGTFSGKDYITGKDASGSYSC